jgi:hypothetical protein
MKLVKSLLTIVALAGILSFIIGPSNNLFAQVKQNSSNQTTINKLPSLSPSSPSSSNLLSKPTKNNNNSNTTTTISSPLSSNTHYQSTKNPNSVNQTNSTLTKAKSNGFLNKIEHGFKNLFDGSSKK